MLSQSIQVILGPMFSGKSTELKRRIELFELAQVQGKDTRVERGLVRRRLRGKP